MTTRTPLVERLSLMVITDPDAAIGLVEAATAAIEAGASSVQLRWKGAGTRDLLDLALLLRKLTHDSGALLIVNDRVDVALAVDADGAHLGDDDIPLEVARRIVPPGFILGRSVDNWDEAARAQREGADYVGLGPVYATASKTDVGGEVGPGGVAAVRNAVGVPIVAIGGITPLRAAAVIAAGADGIAAIGAVMGQPDPGAATRALLAEIRAGAAMRHAGPPA